MTPAHIICHLYLVQQVDRIHSHAHTYAHTVIYAHDTLRAHARMRAHTHTHTHTHTLSSFVSLIANRVAISVNKSTNSVVSVIKKWSLCFKKVLIANTVDKC